MECKELFIFENGQPVTTPPPQVSFWAFRLTVAQGWPCTEGSSSGRGPSPLCTLEFSSVLFCFQEGKFSSMPANLLESIVNEIGPAKEMV